MFDDYKEYPKVDSIQPDLTQASPLRFKAVYRDSTGNDFYPLSMFTKEDFPEDTNDLYHDVGAGEANRLDYLSYVYYETADFWWVLAVVNDIQDPLTGPVAGVRLRIPSVADIWSVLSGRK